MVVAEGGDNPIIIGNIQEAVQVLFQVEAHKIKVMKMKMCIRDRQYPTIRRPQTAT